MKRKTAERYPNGRLKRPTVEQLKQLEAERYRENMQQVAIQPHRRAFRDPLDPRLENALGRFCVLHRLRGELYDAGNEWAEIRRSWNAAKGAPSEVRLGHGGSGAGPSDATVARWGRMLQDIDEALTDVNAATLWAVRRLCIDDVLPPREYERFLVPGLSIVAVTLGRVESNVHPFVRAA
jgi:hypothetical protein